MYVNENMSGVSNVLGVMNAKHYYKKFNPFNKSMLNHKSFLRVTRVNNLFTHVIPLPSSPFDSFIREGNPKSESLHNRNFHLTITNFSVLLNNKIRLL